MKLATLSPTTGWQTKAGQSMSQRFPTLPGLIVGLLAASLAVLVGMALGGRAWLPAVLLAALLIYAPLLRLFARHNKSHEFHFWILVALVIGMPLVNKLTGYGLLSFIELTLVALAPAALLRWGPVWREGQGWRSLTLVLLVFMALGILSTLAAQTKGAASAFQLLTNMKWLVMVLTGYTIALTNGGVKWFWRLVAWFWLPNAALIAWQFADFGSYLSFFSGSTTGGADPWGVLPSRGMGLMHHPTALGALAGFFCVSAAARYASRFEGKFLLLAGIYAVLIALSGQRQELIAAALASATLVVLARGWRRSLAVLVPMAICVAAAAVFAWPYIQDGVAREVQNWGGSAVRSLSQPRPVLYSTAIDLANEHFPLGSGLGTFAGAGSVKFDMSLYWKLGFGAFGWMERREYLMDTYWPNFLAESGWLGLTLMVIVVLLLVRVALLNVRAMRDPEARSLAMVGLGGVVFVLFVTPTSPAFQDPNTFLLPALFIGIAYNFNRRRATAAATGQAAGDVRSWSQGSVGRV